MSSSLRRGALAAAVLAFSIASLAACAAGNNAQTLEIKPDNAATTVGDIKIQNAIVITQPAPATKGPAAVSATLFNGSTKDQTLDSITVEGAGTVEITPAKGEGNGGKVVVPAGGSVILGGEGNASAVLAEPGAALKDGNAQKVTFTFSETGEVSLRAFVVPAEGHFEKWGPSDIPEVPATSPTPTDEASASTSPAASGSPAGEEGTTEEQGTAAGSTASPDATASNSPDSGTGDQGTTEH
ncbi:copper chaperone PCu(A)C [Streptomyces ipomoeae]|uniref:copper chaperone PCu(A)C n=1 Tax=Streptomyces ipomoeae TaxID=103232 RepID=UPI0029A564B8|nr:copper chaperone PCu(A)C [Streptomyces ipomoeae]MDX2826921.1 copper chaperone PCu(A)C [Streptomyces ipomoeae]MDX2879520.1 copper chaperone PCu(A)C [Streptomyces ipomoeae]